MIKIWYRLIYCSTHFFNMIPLEGTPSAIYYLNTTSYDKLQQSLFTTACLPSTWSTPWGTSNRKFSIQQHNTTIHKLIFLNHCIFLQNIQSYPSCFCDRRHILTITNRWPMVRIWSIHHHIIKQKWDEKLTQTPENISISVLIHYTKNRMRFISSWQITSISDILIITVTGTIYIYSFLYILNINTF